MGGLSDTEMAPERAETSEKFRRAGLTQSESERLARNMAMREETRRFWRASPLGMLLWLVWKLLFKGLQPAWMLASIATASWYGLLILEDLGGLGVVATAPPDLSARIEARFEADRGRRDDVYGLWVEQLDAALDGDLRRRSDLDRLVIWAEAGPYFIGRDRLALELLAADGDIGAVEAELRALPPQAREARLSQALAEPLRRPRNRNLEPATMVYAPERVQARYAEALPQWSLIADPVEDFLRGTETGQLDVRSLPGLSRYQAGDILLYGGIRHLVIQLCRAPGATVFAQSCGAAIPAQTFDPFLLSLAAWEAGLLERRLDTIGAAQGASLIRAAYTTGWLSAELEAELRALFEDYLPPSLVIAAASEAQLDPLDAFLVPGRYRQALRGRLTLDRTSVDLQRLGQGLQVVYELQELTSPSLAVRMVASLSSLSEAPALLVLAEEMGSGVLALHETAGASMYTLIEVETREAEVQPENARGLAFAILSALIVLLLSLRRMGMPVMIRRASRLQAVDAYFSRLFLGKNA